MLHLGVGSAAPFPLYDADAIGVRIQEALEESSGRPRERRALLRGGDTGESALALAPTRTTLKPHDQSAPSAPLVRPSKPVIERAHRWSPAELPWVCSVQVPPGIDTRIINLSRTGILIESGSKLGVGSVTGVHLWGPDTALVVPARVVRSDVASVAAAGVRYWIAAAFNGRLDTVPEAVAQPTPLAFSPRSLAELLARIAAQVDRGQRAGDVKAMFEEGVRQLTSAQEVKIRETPALANDRESVYFKVPDPFGRRAVLQVIFEAGHEPGAEEFMLLKAAAASAALVLQPQPTPPHQARKGGQRNSW
jgi:hypothetical protein